MCSRLWREKNRTEDMPTFPCLGGNKKKREKNEKLDFARAFLRPSGNDFDRGKDVDTNSLRRGRGRRRERRRSFPRPLSRAHIDVESFFVCVLNLSPYRRIKSIFFIYRKKKRAAERKKRELKFPNLKKERKTKNN